MLFKYKNFKLKEKNKSFFFVFTRSPYAILTDFLWYFIYIFDLLNNYQMFSMVIRCCTVYETAILYVSLYMYFFAMAFRVGYVGEIVFFFCLSLSLPITFI